MTSWARVDAMQRLKSALVEEDRLGEMYLAAIGTSSEFGAHARLQGASDEVAVRQHSLDSIDDGAGRVWVHGLEVGGEGSLFEGLEESHD